MTREFVLTGWFRLWRNGPGISWTRERPLFSERNAMDCRIIAKRIRWTKARELDRQGLMPMEVWQRGRELLRERGVGR